MQKALSSAFARIVFAISASSFVSAQGSSPSPAQNQNAPSPQQIPAQSSSSAPVQPLFWTNPDPNAQVTVLENTPLRVMTNEAISTRQTHAGAQLLFTLNEDVVVNNVLIIPRGAVLHGTVVESRHAGTLTGAPDLILQLTSLDLGGRSYPLYTYQFKAVGTSKTKPTEAKIKGGAIIGAIAGAIVNGSASGSTSAAGKLAGMGTGAAVGAGVGTAVSAVTPGPVLAIPSESQLEFSLASPISIVPASQKEAERLSQGILHGGPVLYVRGETP